MTEAPKRIGPAGTELMQRFAEPSELAPCSEDGGVPVPGYGIPPDAFPLQTQAPYSPPFPAPSSLPASLVRPSPRAGASALAQRLPGALLLLAGGALCAINGVFIVLNGEFHPKLFIIALPALFGGAWLLVFGRPSDARTGAQPAWWLIGMFAASFLGLLAGLVVAFALAA